MVELQGWWVSIPVLVNLRLGVRGRVERGKPDPVSIPVLVNLRLGVDVTKLPKGFALCVSIPVLVNLRLGDEDRVFRAIDALVTVSIPVLVNLRLGGHPVRRPGARATVSIPVLVNLRLGVRHP